MQPMSSQQGAATEETEKVGKKCKHASKEQEQQRPSPGSTAKKEMREKGRQGEIETGRALLMKKKKKKHQGITWQAGVGRRELERGTEGKSVAGCLRAWFASRLLLFACGQGFDVFVCVARVDVLDQGPVYAVEEGEGGQEEQARSKVKREEGLTSSIDRVSARDRKRQNTRDAVLETNQAGAVTRQYSRRDSYKQTRTPWPCRCLCCPWRMSSSRLQSYISAASPQSPYPSPCDP